MSEKSKAILSVMGKLPGKCKRGGGRLFSLVKKHKIITILMVIVIIASLVAGVLFSRKKDTENNTMVFSAKTEALSKMDISNSISVTGTLASADSRSISTNLSGTEVKEVNVVVGDEVKAGDVICTFESNELEDSLEEAESSQSLAALKNQKSLDNASDSVEDAQEKYEDDTDTQYAAVVDAKEAWGAAVTTQNSAAAAYTSAQAATVAANQGKETAEANKSALQAAVDTAKQNLDAANSMLATATADYEAAKNVDGATVTDTIYNAYTSAQAVAKAAQTTYDNAVSAYKTGYTDKITAYQNAVTAEAAAKTASENAAGNADGKYAKYLAAVETQEETVADSEEAIAESKVDYSISAKEAESNLQNAQNQVQQAEDKLGECVVTSPIDGVITSIAVDVGDVYESGTLFEVQNLTGFVVDATVDEYDISSIEKGMSAVIKTDATGEDEFEGIVTFVAPTPTSTQGSVGSSTGSSDSSSSYSIQITLQTTDERFRVGMTAKTSIILESAQDVFAVPYDSIETDQEGNSYITVQNGEQTDKITVTTGLESDYYTEISGDGLSEGMQVVISSSEIQGGSGQDTASEDESGALSGLLPSSGGDRMQGGAPSGGAPSGGAPSGGAPGGF